VDLHGNGPGYSHWEQQGAKPPYGFFAACWGAWGVGSKPRKPRLKPPARTASKYLNLGETWQVFFSAIIRFVLGLGHFSGERKECLSNSYFFSYVKLPLKNQLFFPAATNNLVFGMHGGVLQSKEFLMFGFQVLSGVLFYLL